MSNKLVSRLLSFTLSATVALTSGVPALAYDGGGGELPEEELEILDLEEEEDLGSDFDVLEEDIVEDEDLVVEENEEDAEFESYADVKIVLKNAATTGSKLKILKDASLDYGVDPTWSSIATLTADTSDAWNADGKVATILADSENGFSFILAPDTDSGMELKEEFILATTANTWYDDHTARELKSDKSTWETGSAAVTKVAIEKVTDPTKAGYMVEDFDLVQGYKVVTLTPALLQAVITAAHDKNGVWVGDGSTFTDVTRPKLTIEFADVQQGSVIVNQPVGKGGATVGTMTSINRKIAFNSTDTGAAGLAGITITPDTYKIDDAKFTVKISKGGSPIEDNTYKAEYVAKKVTGTTGIATDIVEWNTSDHTLYFYQALINAAYKKGWTIDVEVDVTKEQEAEYALSVYGFKDGYVYSGSTKLAKVEKENGKAFESTVKVSENAKIFITGERDSENNQRVVSALYYTVGDSTTKIKATDTDASDFTVTASIPMSAIKNSITFYPVIKEVVVLDADTATDFNLYDEDGVAIVSGTTRIESGKPYTFNVQSKDGKGVNAVTYKIGKSSATTITGTNGKYTTGVVSDVLTINVTKKDVGLFNVSAAENKTGVFSGTIAPKNANANLKEHVRAVYYGPTSGIPAFLNTAYGAAVTVGDSSRFTSKTGKAFVVATQFKAASYTGASQYGYAISPNVAGDSWWTSNGAVSVTGTGLETGVAVPMLSEDPDWNQTIGDLSGKTFTIQPLTYNASTGATTTYGIPATITLGDYDSAGTTYKNVSIDAATSGEPYYFVVTPSGSKSVSSVKYTMGGVEKDATYVSGDPAVSVIYKTEAVTGDIHITATEAAYTTVKVDAASAVDVYLMDAGVARKVTTTGISVVSGANYEVTITPKSAERPYTITGIGLNGAISAIAEADRKDSYTYTITPSAAFTISASTEQAADPGSYSVEFKNKPTSTEDSKTALETGKKATDQLKNTYDANGKLLSQSLTISVGETANLCAASNETAITLKSGVTMTAANTEFSLGKTLNSVRVATNTTGAIAGVKAGEDVITLKHLVTDGAPYTNNKLAYTATLPLTVVDQFQQIYIDADSDAVEKDSVAGTTLNIKYKTGRLGEEGTLKAVDSTLKTGDVVFEMDPDISTIVDREYGFTTVATPAGSVDISTNTNATAKVVANTLQSKPIKVVANIYKYNTSNQKKDILLTLSKEFNVVADKAYVVVPEVSVASGVTYTWDQIATAAATINAADLSKAVALEKDGFQKTANIKVDIYEILDPTVTTVTNETTLKAAIKKNEVRKLNASEVSYAAKIIFNVDGGSSFTEATKREVEYAKLTGSAGNYTVTAAKKTGTTGIEVVTIEPSINGVKQSAVKLGFSVTEKKANQVVTFNLEGRKYSATGKFEDKDGKDTTTFKAAGVANAATDAVRVANMLKTTYLADYERSEVEDFLNKYKTGVKFTVENGTIITLPTEADFDPATRDKRAVLVGWEATVGSADIKTENGKMVDRNGGGGADTGFLPGQTISIVGDVTFKAVWAPRYQLDTTAAMNNYGAGVATAAASFTSGQVKSEIVDAEATAAAKAVNPSAANVKMDAYDATLTDIAVGVNMPVVIKAYRAYGVSATGAVLSQPVYVTSNFTLAYDPDADAIKKEAATPSGTHILGVAPDTSGNIAPIIATIADPVESGVTWTVTNNAINITGAKTYKVAFTKAPYASATAADALLNTEHTDLLSTNKVTKLSIEKSEATKAKAVVPVAFVSGQATTPSIALTEGNVEFTVSPAGVIDFERNATDKYTLDVTALAVGTATITAKVTDNMGNTATGTLDVEVIEDKVEIQLTNKKGDAVTAVEALAQTDNSSVSGDDLGKVYAKAVLKSDGTILTGTWGVIATGSEIVTTGTDGATTDDSGRRVIRFDTRDTSASAPDTGIRVLGTDNKNVFVTFTTASGVVYKKQIDVTSIFRLALKGNATYNVANYSATDTGLSSGVAGSDYLFVLVDGKRQINETASAAAEQDVPATLAYAKVTAADQKVSRDDNGWPDGTTRTVTVDLSKFSAEMVKDKKVVTTGEFREWFVDDGLTTKGSPNTYTAANANNFKKDLIEVGYPKGEIKNLGFAAFTSGVYTLTPSMGDATISSVVASPATVTLVNEKDKNFANVTLALTPGTTADQVRVYPDNFGFFNWHDGKLTTYTTTNLTASDSAPWYASAVENDVKDGLLVTNGTAGTPAAGTATFAVAMATSSGKPKAGKTNLKVYSKADTTKSKLLATVVLRIDGLDTVGDDIYYIEDGERVKDAVKTVGEDKYVFGADGKLISGNKVYTLNGKKVLIRNSALAKAGVWTIDTETYITNENGEILSGWQTFEGKKYYADPANEDMLVDGFQEIEGKSYYFVSHAVTVASSSANEYEQISGTDYYVNKDGEIAKAGIFKVAGVNRLFRDNYKIVKHTDSDVVDGKIKVGSLSYVIHDDDSAELDDIFYNAQVTWTKKFDSKYTKGTGLPVIEYTITYTSKNSSKSVTTEAFAATVTADKDYSAESTATEITFTATADLTGYWKDADAKEAATAAPLTETYKFKNGGLYGTTGQEIGGEMMVEGLEDEYFFTGAAIKPAIVVTDGDFVLAQGVDYKVTYKNNKKISSKGSDGEYTKTAEVTVTGIGNYSGQGQTLYFAIIDPKDDVKEDDADLSGASFRLPKETLIYTGEAVYPSAIELKLKGGSYVTYKHQGDGLYANDDSDIPAVVTFANNINKGSATVMLTGKPNAKGVTKTLKKNFTIKALALNTTDFTVNVSETAVWAVKGAQPEVTVTWNGSDLVLGQDFTVTYDKSNKKVGASKVTVKGKGNFTKKLEQSFTVTALPLAEEMVAAVSAFVGKKGAKVTLLDGAGNVIPTSLYTVSVFDGETDVTKAKLEADKDYTIKIAKKAGKTELGDDALEITAQAGINLSSVKINAKSVEKTFTGEAITLTDDDIAKITVTYKGTTLVYGTDYEITGYANNIKKGKMTVTIAGMGKYAGFKTFKVKIAPKPIAATN